MSVRWRAVLMLVAAVAVLVMTGVAWLSVMGRERQSLKDQAAQSLSLKGSNVVAEVERFRYLPFVLGQDERIHRLIDTNAEFSRSLSIHDPPFALGPQQRVTRRYEAALQAMAVANVYLDTVNAASRSDDLDRRNDLFVVDAAGVARASSNRTFIGKVYSFRPYFKDAMSKGEGRYYARGATSGEPGYFLSRRVATAAGNSGVIVAKADLRVLTKTWTKADEQVSLVDGAGMIFLSNVEGWTYQPLYSLAQQERDRIVGERQYPPDSVDKAPLLPGPRDTTADLYLAVRGSNMLLQFKDISDYGWRILGVYDVAPVYWAATRVAAIVFLGSALMFALGFYLFEHRQRIRANQLREILENMSAGIAVFDRDLRLVAWNEKYLKLNSYPESLVAAGRPYADIIKYGIARGDHGPGDPAQQLRERLDRLRQHSIRQFEVRRPDGTWVDIVRNRMPNGTLIQTYTDVTERKQAAAELDAHRNNLESLVRERTAEIVRVNGQLQETVEQLESAKRTAEEASRAKTTFLNAVSHDIRNPLNAILGYASLVLSNARDRLPEKQYRNLQKLAAKGRELNEMVGDFLDYSRAGRVSTTEFALAPLIQECQATIEPMVDSQRVQVTSDIADDLPLLVQDERKLRRAIINLLSNAAKFTEHGTISLTAVRRGDSVDISVADTGIGIAEEFQDRIFAEFERVEVRGERPREGTGLGLAICRRFVTLMSGEIAVQSTVGRGSVFTISIPIVHPTASVATQAKEQDGQQRADTAMAGDDGAVRITNGQSTLLIVDDSRENRDYLVQLLEKSFRVLVAEDGKRAVEMTLEQHPDLVLMDLSLPIYDGWEATRRIKGHAACGSIPVIAVSAHATAQDRADAEAAGCSEFLAKPVDEKALFETLRRFLGARVAESFDGRALHHSGR